MDDLYRHLKEALEYSPTTGLFIRKIRTSNRIKIGDIAGGLDAKGYVIIRLKNKSHKAHRLAWLYVYGEMPSKEIDHINGIKNDNRISNLRDVSKNINQQNTNAKGYHKDRNKWAAQIRVNKETHYLGSFESEAAASIAYKNAKELYHAEAHAIPMPIREGGE